MEEDRMSKRYGILLVLFSALLWSAGISAKDVPRASQGTVYVPASYQELFINSAVTQRIVSRLFIRNTDMENSISVNSVRFYDPDGNFVREFVIDSMTLSPLASTSFAANSTTLPVSPYPQDGGRPFFIVEWSASAKVNTPIIENARVFVQGGINGSSLHGLSITPGQQIR